MTLGREADARQDFAAGSLREIQIEDDQVRRGLLAGINGLEKPDRLIAIEQNDEFSLDAMFLQSFAN